MKFRYKKGSGLPPQQYRDPPLEEQPFLVILVTVSCFLLLLEMKLHISFNRFTSVCS